MKTVYTGDVATTIALQDGALITATTQDCTPYAEEAKRKHREGEHGSREMRLAANLPDVLIEKYCNLHGIDFREWMTNPVHMKRMLSDPDLKDFRIWPGKV